MYFTLKVCDLVSLAFFSVTVGTHRLRLSYLPQIILRHYVHIPSLFLILFNIYPHLGAFRRRSRLVLSGSDRAWDL
ncbi:hypothetical protein H6F74_00265 [Trichocoleus sp. FACHB-90]|uniref:hypothetical protein n=1 Tax=Cyanophyceae TaxID=3028117 RepID=UPI0016893908|nr:hypothetical protein [Trichocoleus sp. FACHB-90]MBD1924727.1 hypothetical protein [Trichocoleus sp. FACHB-90]